MEGERWVGQFQPLQVKRFEEVSAQATPESRFWRSFKASKVDPLAGNVTCVDFCAAEPYHVAVTSSTRVVVYSSVTCKPVRTFSRFKGLAFSGRFRSDGQLLVAGGDRGIVQVFDGASRTILRQLTGHKDAVRAVRFSPDKVHVLSGGDDKSVLWFDVGSTDPLRKMVAHTDYVRSVTCSPISNDLWATGSYDRSVLLWDLRVREPVMRLLHGQQVEDCLFLPSGTLLASAGGTHVAIWDLMKGGAAMQDVAQLPSNHTGPHQRPLFRLSNHQKAVTSLHISPSVTVADPDGASSQTLPPRLLTGSLDGHVRFFSIHDYKMTHAARYAAPVLSVGVSANNATVAVGMAAGQLALRRRQLAPEEEASWRASGTVARVPGMRLPGERRVRSAGGGMAVGGRKWRVTLRAGTSRYFMRGQTEEAAAEDYFVAQKKRSALRRYENFLRTFRFSEALGAALERHKKAPEVVVAVVEELVACGALRLAVQRLPKPSLYSLVDFIQRNVVDPRYRDLAVPLAHLVLDVCTPKLAADSHLDYLVRQLSKAVAAETELQVALVELQGLLSPLLRTSLAANAAVAAS